MEHNQDQAAAPGWPAPAGPAPIFPASPPPAAGPPGRGWMLWAGAIGLVAVLVGVLVVPKLVSAATGPTRGANAYLRLIRDDQADASYGLLCAELRRAVSPADYAAGLQAQNDDLGHVLSFDVYQSTVQIGGNAGVVRFRVRTTKGDLAREARLIHEDGQWRWCGAHPLPKEVGVTVHVP